jgi:hypothetical protein
MAVSLPAIRDLQACSIVPQPPTPPCHPNSVCSDGFSSGGSDYGGGGGSSSSSSGSGSDDICDSGDSGGKQKLSLCLNN